MTSRILITGGLGYLGGRIARHLAPSSELLLGTRRSDVPNPDWLKTGRVIRLDVLSDDIAAAFRGVDVVIHLAAVNENDSLASPANALRVNAGGTLNVLTAAKAAAVKRFVYFSTAHIYGSPLTGTITEQTLPKPVHPYAITHRAAEDFVLAERAIEGIVIRLSNGFGAPERTDVDRWTLLVNDLCRQAVTTQSLVLKSSGMQRRDFVTLHDTARAVEHLIELPAAALGDRLFNVGGENSMTVYDVARFIQTRCQATLGFRPEIKRPQPDPNEVSLPLHYDIQKLKATGFQLNGDMALEIDETLRLCHAAFLRRDVLNLPKVSVVIPTYNQAHFLGEAIRSVIAQTERAWEMIIVNNRSTDNTVEVAKSFNDPRIRLIEIDNGGIIAKSRNRGLADAKAAFVAFLDSDDCWYPEKLARCLAVSAGTDIVCHGEVWTRNGRALRKVRYGPERRATYHSLLYDDNCVSTSAVLARRALLIDVGGFGEDAALITAEDYDLWLRLAHRGARFRFIDDMLGEYRLHDTSASSSTLRHFAAIREVVERHHAALDDGSLASRSRMRRRRAILDYGTARSLQNAGSRAWRWIARAAVTYPFLPRIYYAAIRACFPARRVAS
jgi:UDP-glucose 4-epimerase